VVLTAYVPDPMIRTGKSDLVSVELSVSESVIVMSQCSLTDMQPLIFPADVALPSQSLHLSIGKVVTSDSLSPVRPHNGSPDIRLPLSQLKQHTCVQTRGVGYIAKPTNGRHAGVAPDSTGWVVKWRGPSLSAPLGKFR
jgi:hypothetical protein